jgi:hypothetical protein
LERYRQADTKIRTLHGVERHRAVGEIFRCDAQRGDGRHLASRAIVATAASI